MSDLKTDALEEYNPFGDPSLPETLPLGNSRPAVLPPPGPESPADYDSFSLDKPGALLPPSQPALTVGDLERRQAELDARAAQLDLREKQAEQQEAWRTEHGYSTAEVPNWPPFPSWFCISPCVRMDFIADIPSQTRWLAKYSYYLWIAYSLLLLLNVFGTLSYLIVSPTLMESGPLFGVSIVVFAAVSPAAFFCWNRPLYKALKKNSSMQFCIFFPFFGIQIVLILIQILGINYLGSCGWINGIKALSFHKGVGSFMLFIAALFTACGAASVFLIMRVHLHYRGSGASGRRAKQELTQEVVGSAFNNS